MMRRTMRSDAGDTLLEVLLALLIVSLGVVALMGGLATSIAGSATHRGLSTLDNVLKSFAESAKYQIQLQGAPNALYAPCALVSGQSYNGTTIDTSNVYMPSGYAVFFTPSSALYWSSSGPVDYGDCNPATQTGFQLLSVTATGPKGVTQTLQFGVRTP